MSAMVVCRGQVSGGGISSYRRLRDRCCDHGDGDAAWNDGADDSTDREHGIYRRPAYFLLNFSIARIYDVSARQQIAPERRSGHP